MKRFIVPLLLLFSLTSCGTYTYNDFYGSEYTNSYEFDIPEKKQTKETVPATTSVSDDSSEESETTAAPVKTIESADDKGKVKAIDVPFISQDKFPTGCELVSTSMVLQFYGMNISPENIISEGYMEAVEVKEDPSDRSKKTGGDPNEVFVGSPEKNTGYGCYSGAVYKAMKKYLSDKAYTVSSLMGMELDVMCSRYIDNDIPVIIWATFHMEPSYRLNENKWTIIGTDEEFSWLSNEHCLVLVGYDDEYYYFNDPQTKSGMGYKRDVVEERYSELGKQALVITPQ